MQTTGTVAFDGDLSTQVLAPISGPVMRILVQPGAWVKRGRCAGDGVVAGLRDARCRISGRRRRRRCRRAAWRRSTRRCSKNDAIARRDLEQAQTDAVSAEADRDAALQALQALGVDSATLARLRDNKPVAAVQGVIRAPIEGTVVEKLINPGQLLRGGNDADVHDRGSLDGVGDGERVRERPRDRCRAATRWMW